MADGEGEPPEGGLDVELGRLSEAELRTGIWKRITAWRHTGFLTAFALAAIALTAVVFWHTFSGQPVLETPEAKLWFLSAAVLSLIPLALLLRDSRDNFAHGPSLRLPVLSLTLLVALTSALVAADVLQLGLAYTPPELACVFALLALVFVPLVWNAANLARFQADERKKTEAALANIEGMTDSRDAEAMGALIATLVVGSIIAFAICAGIYNESVSFDNLIGIGVGFIVVGAFAVVVFMDPLSDLLPVKWLSRVFGWAARAARPLAAFYDAVDTFLVRIVAVMAGMEHRTVAARYLILGTVLVCFCVLGWYMPPGWGLIPCALGILTAVSVSRLWSWVEDDRALAALTDFKPSTPYRTPMREDYRDETLLGFLFVFFLIPVMMSDAHWSGLFGEDMFNLPKGEATSFLDWFGYFGVTLIKAVPIVDWAEIYNFGQPPADGSTDLITMNTVASQHAVFMARSTVDLVLIASLLQAISITGRNRQQKRLYKAGADRSNKFRPGLIDRLDTFVERTELKRAYMATLNRNVPWPEKSTTAEQANKRHFDLRKLSQSNLVDFRRYNPDRLAQLHGELKDPVARAFIAAIAFERPDLDLAPRLVLLDNMAEKKAPESELYTLLERIRADFADNAASVDLSIDQLRSILFHTAKRAGLQEFKHRVIALMKHCQPGRDVIEALADVAGRSNPDTYQYTKKSAVYAIRDVARIEPNAVDVRFAIGVLNELRGYNSGAGVLAVINECVADLERLLQTLTP